MDLTTVTRRPGSSPLTRGKLAGGSAETYKQGLIPAHAGKTEGERARYADDGAHPRSRGENVAEIGGEVDGPGSSPLTRGKPRIARIAGLPRGLIPAHAGKTFVSTSSACPARAHPRSRGENVGR